MVSKIIKLNIAAMLMIFSFSSLFLMSCGDEKVEPKSMSQIYEEEGIPVEIQVIENKTFTKNLSFITKLKGIKEATKGAPIGGKIEKINKRVGDYVKEGDIVLQFPEDAPSLQYEQAKTGYENSKKNYERLKALVEAGETTQAAFDGAETKYLVDKRNYESQKQLLFIEAPFDGRIVDIKINEGDNVGRDTPLFTVAQLYRMRADIYVSEKEINLIRRGLEGKINLGGKDYFGKVTDVGMAIDPYTQAFKVEIEFDNRKGELKSGITTNVDLLVYKNNDAIIIPRNLVQHDDKGSFVFLEKDGVAEKRYISNGRDSGLNYEVSGGLNPGDRLIIKGSANLTNGIKVKVI